MRASLSLMVQSPKWKNLEKPFRKPRQQSRRNDGKTKDTILCCRHTTFKHNSLESHKRKTKNNEKRKDQKNAKRERMNPCTAPLPKGRRNKTRGEGTRRAGETEGRGEMRRSKRNHQQATPGQEQRPNPSPTRGQAQEEPSATAEADRRSPEARARSQKQTAKRAERPKP